MGKWLALLDDETLEAPSQGTDKTVKRGVLSVLAVTHEGVLESSRPSFEPANDPTPPAAASKTARACTNCRNFGPRRTCFEPERAGLIPVVEGFGLVWPDPAHAATCEAFTGEAIEQSPGRPYMLTKERANAAHAEPWGDAAIARFQGRVHHLLRLGFNEADADDLSERLHLRDLQVDCRHLCLECSHYRPGRCGNHRQAGLNVADLTRDFSALLQRCSGFEP